MTLLSKLFDHFTAAAKFADSSAHAVIAAQNDAEALHQTLEAILDLIITLAERAYEAYRKSTQLQGDLEAVNADLLVNKIRNIQQILLLTERVAAVEYIELADKIVVIKDDETLDYALREAHSQDPEAVKRLVAALERWKNG